MLGQPWTPLQDLSPTQNNSSLIKIYTQRKYHDMFTPLQIWCSKSDHSLTLSDVPVPASLLATGWTGSFGSVWFSPCGQTLCVAMCFFTLDFCENARPHTTHWKGFSPVWLRKCCCMSKFLANCLLQYLHLSCKQTNWHNSSRDKHTILSCYYLTIMERTCIVFI